MRESEERVVWEFRRAVAPMFVPLDFGAYRTVALLAQMPWRGVAVGLPSALLLYWVGRALLPEPDDGLLAFVGFLLVMVLGGIELLNRRDVLTPTHLVQRRGLLGRREIRTPLQTVSRVEYQYPRWGVGWNVGDIYVTTEVGGIDLIGVADAAHGAQQILDAKARLVDTTDS